MLIVIIVMIITMKSSILVQEIEVYIISISLNNIIANNCEGVKSSKMKHKK